MRERGLTLLLALAALAAFYALWLQPVNAFDPDADMPRPTTAERRGDGYSAAFDWLERSGVEVLSWRERYTALADSGIAPRGNLLVLTLPGEEVFRSEEFGALDKWVRRGNTLLINAALLDQPQWAAGRGSRTVAEVEALTSIEFETPAIRDARLDETPLAQRVREADIHDAQSKDDDEDEAPERRAATDDDEMFEIQPQDGNYPAGTMLKATGPHALLAGVQTLYLENDDSPLEWSLRMPYDNFVLTLARDAKQEGALFEQRLGAGRVLLVSGGSLFTNRALGHMDNARLLANIVSVAVADGGVVLFDDLRQGLSASYDPARFYGDSRLYKTAIIVLGLWLAWVLGGTRLRAPPVVTHDPSEADLVRSAGGLIARTVASWQAANAMFEDFFSGVARGTRAAERDRQWQWLEGHAALLPQELDQLRKWYADARAMREVPLVPLRNLLDQLERRLKT
jgi:hypothetical protein